MGFDVSFHVVTLEELENFVFAPLANPQEIPRCISILSRGADSRLLENLYGNFQEWKNGPLSASEMPWTLRFAASIISGYLHPYWYARNQAISLLPERFASEKNSIFSPMSKFFPTGFRLESEEAPLTFLGNYSASGLIEPNRFENVELLLDVLREQDTGKDGPKQSERGLSFEGQEAIRCAIAFARTIECCLIEATDVVIPLQDKSLAPLINLRARFLGNIAP